MARSLNYMENPVSAEILSDVSVNRFRNAGETEKQHVLPETVFLLLWTIHRTVMISSETTFYCENC